MINFIKYIEMNFKSFIKNNFKGGNIYTFVGGGGKSSSIFKIAKILSDNGYRVRVSTTTKIGLGEFPNFYIKKTNSLNIFQKTINNKLNKILIFNKYSNKKNRYIGFPKFWFDTLILKKDIIFLIEGDGSKRKYFKIPKSYEPVIPKSSVRVFLLIGGSIINEKITEKNTYNFKKIKIISNNVSKYDIETLLKIIKIGWKNIFSKYNCSILINQGDLFRKRILMFKLANYLYKKTNIENYVISIKNEKIYMKNEINVIGIILAAGKSERMGKNIKCLLKINKYTFLQKSIHLLNRVVKNLIVVVGFEKEKIIKHIKNEDCKIVFIKKYYLGMGHTLKEIVKKIPKKNGFFIHFCDLPFIKNDVIDLLYKEVLKNKNKVIIPNFKGIKGHPIYFPESSRFLFKKLKGDEGAKNILNQLKIKNIQINDSGIIKDIDNMKDYRRFINND